MFPFLCLGVKMTLKNKQRNNEKGKGNRKEQLKRRRKRQKNQVPKTKNSYWCIDGNFTNHPVAYCTHYHGVLTQGLMDVHKCKEHECFRLREGDKFE